MDTSHHQLRPSKFQSMFLAGLYPHKSILHLALRHMHILGSTYTQIFVEDIGRQLLDIES